MQINRGVVQWMVLGLVVVFVSAAALGQIAIGISVRIGPPVLPVYAQPICPGPGYIWTPGYWAWNDEAGYYWVPGTWVLAPVGMYWTPGYWGWSEGFYVWHAGYWGPHIGFYGGINYGYGYTGVGFVGGEWRGRALYYNRSVTNVSVTNVTNVYNKTVIVNNTTVNNVSYNGGAGGVQTRPTAREQAAMREPHTAPLAMQTQHETLASQNHQNFASVNQGKPAIAATAKAGDFSSHSIVAARAAGGVYHAPATSPKEARGPSTVTPAASGSNQGFRSFTPPNSNKPSQTTGNAATTTQGGTNQGFRSFTPPNSNKPQNWNAPSKPAYQQKGSSGSNPTFQPSNKPGTVMTPPSKSNVSPPPPPPHKLNPPPPPPHKQNAPKEEHNRDKRL
jgi:hypothetical protein